MTRGLQWEPRPILRGRIAAGPMEAALPQTLSEPAARPPAPPASAAGEGPAAAVLPGPVCVDTHAHLHEAFDLGDALAAARRHAARAGGGTCVLCLASTPGEDAFERLAAGEAARGLAFKAAPGEAGVLVAAPADGLPALVLVGGRQLVTRERVEVLALAPASTEGLRSGRTLAETLADAAAAGAVVVLPRGVGKWLGARGRLVLDAVEADGSARLCVADNAGCFGVAPAPRVLERAAALGRTVLTGSDPLPLAGSGSRLGGAGVVLPGPLVPGRIGETLRRELPALGPHPKTFGGRAGFFRSAREQLELRLRGRKQRDPHAGEASP